MSPQQKSGPPSDYNAVLLEEIRSQMNGVIETVQVTGQQLNDKIDTVHKELKQDIQLVQVAIRGHSQEIKVLQQETISLRQETTALRQETTSIRQETTALRQDIKNLDKKMDGIEQRLSDKIDAVAEKVESHDGDIRVLKATVSLA